MSQASQSKTQQCKKCGAALDAKRTASVCLGCALESALAPSASGEADTTQVATGNLTAAHRSLGRFGDYELIEEIARGGMGVVFKARQLSLDRFVAVKMLLFGPMASAAEVQRFRAEAAAAASLQHPNIVAVHEVGFRDGQHFIVMDYVDGPGLAELARNGPLTPERAAQHVKAIAEAIHYAHERGVLHRDLKPSNVLIDENAQPKVTDFGLAKRLEKDTELTLSGQVLGSPGYMAPEQAAAHRGRVGKRSDIYSLGAILYHLLTGRAPFAAATVAETLAQVQNTEPISPTVLNPHVPRDLKTICLKCLEKDPARRYETAQQLADDLGRWLRKEPVQARPVSPPEKMWRWCRRKPVIATFSAVTVLLLLAIAIGSPIALFHINQHREIAVQNARDLRLSLYAADINLAHEAVRMNNLGRAWELLDRHRPEAGQEDLRGWEWRYLWGLCQSDASYQLCRLPKSDGVESVAIRPGANWAAVSGADRSGIAVWDLSTRRPVARLEVGEFFSHVAFSPDGTRLAFSTVTWLLKSNSSVSWLRVWDCATQRVVAENSTDGSIVSLAFSADGQTIVTFQRDTAVTRWRASNLEELASIPAPKSLAWHGTPFAVTPDLKTAVIVNGLGGIIVLNLESGTERWRTNAPSGYAHAMAISPDGTRLATDFGRAGGAVHIWELATGVLRATLEGHRASVNAVKFWPDGKTLASASGDQTIRIWDLEQRKAIRTLRGHRAEVWSLDLSPDATTLISGAKDGEVLVWDATRDPEKRNSWTLPGRHWSWHFSTDGKAIHAVERAPGSPRRAWRWFRDEGHAIPEVVSNLGQLHRYEGPRFKRFETLPGIPVRDDFTFSRSGRFFAAGATNGVLQVWDLNSWDLAHEFATGAGKFRPVAFATDDTRVWILQEAGKARESILSEWDFRTHQRLRSVSGVRDLHFIFHPDGWLIWSADEKKNFHDLATGQTSQPKGLSGLLGDPAASRSGDLLALCYGDGALRIWETASLRSGAQPREVKSLRGVLITFAAAAFPDDGTRLLAGSRGTDALKIWDTRAYHELLTLEGDEDSSYELQLSADGKTLGALTGAGELHLWSAPSWAEIAAQEKAAQGTAGE